MILCALRWSQVQYFHYLSVYFWLCKLQLSVSMNWLTCLRNGWHTVHFSTDSKQNRTLVQNETDISHSHKRLQHWPRCRRWAELQHGSTLEEDRRTCAGLSSHQAYSQFSPAKPVKQNINTWLPDSYWINRKESSNTNSYIERTIDRHADISFNFRNWKNLTNWLHRLTLILASSGPLVESDTLVPCFSLCLYVFITPQRKALLFCSKH